MIIFRNSNNSCSARSIARQRKLGTTTSPSGHKLTSGYQSESSLIETAGDSNRSPVQSSLLTSNPISTTGSLISRLVREFSGSAGSRLDKSTKVVKIECDDKVLRNTDELTDVNNSFGVEVETIEYKENNQDHTNVNLSLDKKLSSSNIELLLDQSDINHSPQSKINNDELTFIPQLKTTSTKNVEMTEKQQLNSQEATEIVGPIVEDIINQSIERSTAELKRRSDAQAPKKMAITGKPESSMKSNSNSIIHGQTLSDRDCITDSCVDECSKTNIRFVRKSLENTSLSVLYSKSNYYEPDTIETEYPRNLDDNIEILSREAEHLEEQFTASEEKLLHYGPIFDPEKFEEQRKQQKKDDDEDEPIGSSPCGRFFKYDKEVGCGSFKTVFRGWDTQTGVAVAWCELLVRSFI